MSFVRIRGYQGAELGVQALDPPSVEIVGIWRWLAIRAKFLREIVQFSELGETVVKIRILTEMDGTVASGCDQGFPAYHEKGMDEKVMSDRIRTGIRWPVAGNDLTIPEPVT